MFALKGKNTSIELVRIIACLLVIMAHSQFGIVVDNVFIKGRLGMSTVIADDVPLFLLVTGFYFFNRVKVDTDVATTFFHKLKSFAFNIYIPTILYILVSIFYRYFTETNRLGLGNADWDYLGRFIFRLAPGDHLWYICTYMSFVFLFPMLAFLCQDNPERNKLRRILLGTAIVGSIVVDVQYFFRMGMFDMEKFLWGYCTIFLVLGYELSLVIRKHGANRLRLCLWGIGIYLSAFFIKYGLQLYMYSQYGEVNNRFRWLQCTPCFLSAIGLFLVVYSVGSLVKRDGKLSCIINFFGACTFPIYLFHQLVINKTLSWRYDILAACADGRTFITALGYYLGYALAVFFVAFLIALVFKLIVDNTVGRLLKHT